MRKTAPAQLSLNTSRILWLQIWGRYNPAESVHTRKLRNTCTNDRKCWHEWSLASWRCWRGSRGHHWGWQTSWSPLHVSGGVLMPLMTPSPLSSSPAQCWVPCQQRLLQPFMLGCKCCNVLGHLLNHCLARLRCAVNRTYRARLVFAVCCMYIGGPHDIDWYTGQLNIPSWWSLDSPTHGWRPAA